MMSVNVTLLFSMRVLHLILQLFHLHVNYYIILVVGYLKLNFYRLLEIEEANMEANEINVNENLKVLELYSGIGGMHYALKGIFFLK
jgi:hypothetical protein